MPALNKLTIFTTGLGLGSSLCFFVAICRCLPFHNDMVGLIISYALPVGIILGSLAIGPWWRSLSLPDANWLCLILPALSLILYVFMLANLVASLLNINPGAKLNNGYLALCMLVFYAPFTLRFLYLKHRR
jgi:predicted MFS family arabinose efflux permease